MIIASVGVLVNHAISFLTSPLAVSFALIAVAGVILAKGIGKCRLGAIAARVALAFGLFWLWFMSTGLAYLWLGLGLEREFPPARVETLPQADAIVVLSGGVGGNTNVCPYAELYASADRVAHAARIWKAGKAQTVILSGTNEVFAASPFLREFGVPADAILVENESGNTEENARFVAREIERNGAGRRKIILVTSAWHMRRALLMFRKYAGGLEVIPAACDYEATLYSGEFRFWGSLMPNADALCRNSCMLKEYIGYWGYRLLRR